MSKKHSITDHKVKTVELKRDGCGIGFVIGDEKPCIIKSVIKGGFAERAGLKVGDTILKVNGFDVSDACHESIITLVTLSKVTMTLLESSEQSLSCFHKASPSCALHRAVSTTCFGYSFLIFYYF